MLYADYNGSSPMLNEVKDYLRLRMQSNIFANPNAIHSLGQKINSAINESRKTLAQYCGCDPYQIIFNSGASEGITQILSSILNEAREDQKIIITSPIEHSVVLNILEHYEKVKGFKIIYTNVDLHGQVDLNHLRELISEYKCAIVCVMAVNNETGVFQPYQEIASLCKEVSVPYFCDTTQLIGKVPFNFNESQLDYAVCSGHKLGALPGSGFMIIKDRTQLKPLIFGSSQEGGQRGGTQNYLGIETLAIAMKEHFNSYSLINNLEQEKLLFEKNMKINFPEVQIIGEDHPRLPGTTLIGLAGIHGQAVQIELEAQDIFVTTSSACTDNNPETSKVLKAMGVNEDIGRSVIRISLSPSCLKEDYSKLSKALGQAYLKLKKIDAFGY
jgi:cysteine desulfurase